MAAWRSDHLATISRFASTSARMLANSPSRVTFYRATSSMASLRSNVTISPVAPTAFAARIPVVPVPAPQSSTWSPFPDRPLGEEHPAALVRPQRERGVLEVAPVGEFAVHRFRPFGAESSAHDLTLLYGRPYPGSRCFWTFPRAFRGNVSMNPIPTRISTDARRSLERCQAGRGGGHGLVRRCVQTPLAQGCQAFR